MHLSSSSTNVTLLAPLLRASIPILPLPENRSIKDLLIMSFEIILNKASFTKSFVGSIEVLGTSMRLPLCDPDIIRKMLCFPFNYILLNLKYTNNYL